MRLLVIDSHKSTKKTPANNLHWLNSKQIVDKFNGDLIWSYDGVNDDIKGDYDVIVFVHASRYSFVDREWLRKSPNARLFFVTNEYNLGEPYILWHTLKEGRRYEVIANHPAAASKVVQKYVNKWHIVNLNALCVDPKPVTTGDKEITAQVLYYGSFRKDRAKYFQKYFNSPLVIVSSHKKNHEKFHNIGVKPNFIKRVNWSKEGLTPYGLSLYIEDEKTHTHYNYLANRFYEALNYGVVPIFDASCKNTLSRCGYEIGDEYVVDSEADLVQATKCPPPIQLDWIGQARNEKVSVLKQIEDIISS